MRERDERRFYKAVEAFLREEKDCQPRWGSLGTRQEVKLGERQVDVVGLSVRKAPQITPVLLFDHHAVEVKDRIEDPATLKDLIGSIGLLDLATGESLYPQHRLHLYAAVPESPGNRFHEQLLDYCREQKIGYLEVSRGPRQVVTEVHCGEERPNPFVTMSNTDQQSVGHFITGIKENSALAALIPNSPEQFWRDTIGKWKKQYEKQ